MWQYGGQLPLWSNGLQREKPQVQTDRPCPRAPLHVVPVHRKHAIIIKAEKPTVPNEQELSNKMSYGNSLHQVMEQFSYNPGDTTTYDFSAWNHARHLEESIF